MMRLNEDETGISVVYQLNSSVKGVVKAIPENDHLGVIRDPK